MENKKQGLSKIIENVCLISIIPSIVSIGHGIKEGNLQLKEYLCNNPQIYIYNNIQSHLSKMKFQQVNRAMVVAAEKFYEGEKKFTPEDIELIKGPFKKEKKNLDDKLKKFHESYPNFETTFKNYKQLKYTPNEFISYGFLGVFLSGIIFNIFHKKEEK